jgi:hypothetical protein
MWKPPILFVAAICLLSPVPRTYAQTSSQSQDWVQVYTGDPGDFYISKNTARDAKQRNLVHYSILIVLPQPIKEDIQSMVFQFRGWCKSPGANKLVNISYFNASGQPVASIDTNVLKREIVSPLEDIKTGAPGHILLQSACQASNK